jgi:signal transduction histidine kinase
VIRHLSIRVRLTLWYSLAFATALFSLGAASLWMVHRAVDELESNELQQRVRSVRRFLEARPAGETRTDLRQAIRTAYDVSHGDKWLQAIDEHGNWLYRSPHVAAVYPTLALPQRLPNEARYFTYEAGSLYVRALIEPISVAGVRYTVQTGLTLNRTLAALSNFRGHLLLLTVLGLAVSSLAGYFMSGKALSPIAAITLEAQRIGDKNLSSRLPELRCQDELANLSNTLNQMLGRIEAGYQSVRSFTANAAHELRSPVALLRTAVEVTLASPRNADYYRETCERVLENSIQMSRLIDQLLALARADAGVTALEFERVNLPDLLEEVADEWAERFARVGVRFSFKADAGEFWFEADYPSLKSLLNILLENAWRYTPGGRSVTLALSIYAEGAEMSVTDTGIGIAVEDQARIFERFCRIARPIHGDCSGSGLGLALGRWIAARHNSTIELESAVGEGSRFSLRLASMPQKKSGAGDANGQRSAPSKVQQLATKQLSPMSPNQGTD